MSYKLKDCSVVTAITIAYCLIFWWKCLQIYNITRNEKFVWAFQLKDMKKKSLDKNMIVLKHVFINFIFRKLEFLCMSHLLLH